MDPADQYRHTNYTPAAPQSLILFKICSIQERESAERTQLLRRENDWPYIGLRETRDAASYRSTTQLKTDPPVNEETHVILEVRFTPFGIAHFATAVDDGAYRCQPVLHKIWKPWDEGNWHFTRDLPLWLDDAGGNPFIRSEWHPLRTADQYWHTNYTPAAPQSLILFKICSRHEKESAQQAQLLRKENDWQYIGLRETREAASYRATTQVKTYPPVNEETHVILEVIFTPFGIAHFATAADVGADRCQSVLHKMRKSWDEGNWHFTRDLPLCLNDARGNPLIRSEWHPLGTI